MEAIEVSHELRRAQAEFHALAHTASAEDLARRSSGTRWTNRQLLFHMVLGYLVVRTMHFPTDWDPYFNPTMTVLEVYHFCT
jgi:hypothetical protein